ANGGALPWPATLVATIAIGDPSVLEEKGGAYTGHTAGATTVTCSAGAYTDATPATVTVLPGAPATAITQVARTPVYADPTDPGTDVGCLLRDAAGNIVADASGVSIQLANPAAGTVAGAH